MESSNGAPINVDDLLEEGMTFYGLGKFEEAAKKWNKVLELDPANAQALEYLDIVREDLEERRASQALPPETSHQELIGDEVGAEASSGEASELVSKGVALLEQGDPDGAYKVFQELIESGDNNPDTFGYLEMARAARLDRYRKHLENLDKVPLIAMDYGSIKELDLSKEEGFILSQIDGMISFRDILSLARIEKLEAMGILSRLLTAGVIKSEG